MVVNLMAVKTLGVEDDGGEQPERHPAAAGWFKKTKQLQLGKGS